MNEYFHTMPVVRIEIDGTLIDESEIERVAAAIVALRRAERKYARTIARVLNQYG